MTSVTMIIQKRQSRLKAGFFAFSVEGLSVSFSVLSPSGALESRESVAGLVWTSERVSLGGVEPSGCGVRAMSKN